MRIAYLRAMLSQDVGFFDTDASTGEIVSRISSDTLLVQDAISEKVHISTYSKEGDACFCLLVSTIIILGQDASFGVNVAS